MALLTRAAHKTSLHFYTCSSVLPSIVKEYWASIPLLLIFLWEWGRAKSLIWCGCRLHLGYVLPIHLAWEGHCIAVILQLLNTCTQFSLFTLSFLRTSCIIITMYTITNSRNFTPLTHITLNLIWFNPVAMLLLSKIYAIMHYLKDKQCDMSTLR